jgi:hypothetical protein
MRAAIVEFDSAAEAPSASSSYAQVGTHLSPQTMPSRTVSRSVSTSASRPARLNAEGSEPNYLSSSRNSAAAAPGRICTEGSEPSFHGSSRGGSAAAGAGAVPRRLITEGSESSFSGTAEASPAVLSTRSSSRMNSSFARPVAVATFASGAVSYLLVPTLRMHGSYLSPHKSCPITDAHACICLGVA